MSDCLFCRIIAGEIPSTRVYEDEDTFAFRDIQPQAPVHVLVVPKRHIPNWLDAAGETDAALAKLWRAAAEVARLEGIDASGVRLISNAGADARQTVSHLHLHVLGGAPLSERMA